MQAITYYSPKPYRSLQNSNSRSGPCTKAKAFNIIRKNIPPLPEALQPQETIPDDVRKRRFPMMSDDVEVLQPYLWLEGPESREVFS